MQKIAEVVGQQFLPTSDDYERWRRQYATSSFEDASHLSPGLIVMPRDKEDIKRVIAYANANNKAVAIRTGGHQYSGASSTTQDNIQIDLRTTFQSPDDLVYFENEQGPFVRASVSHSLGEFNAFLGEHGAFVPHGQCTSVHLGGHVQTGGYGQLGRSFGLLGDHIFSLEIINHAGEEKEITRASDPDLFFAWLGGSPGNLGVLTHFSLTVHRDADHTGSIGMRAVHLYDPAKLRTLLGYLAQMNDDENISRNYDLCISVLSSESDVLAYMRGLRKEFCAEHPQFDARDTTPRTIIVFAQYTRFDPADKPDMSFFERLQDGCLIGPIEEKPVSALMAQWIFRKTREFDLPYVKRGYLTDSTTLEKDGWVDWVVGRIDAVVGPNHNGQFLSSQIQSFGGRNSMYAKNAGNGTGFSWRDTTLCMLLDNFHHPSKRAEAEAWARTNEAEAIGPQGVFSKQDRRMFWASWGAFDLDSVWETYFEDRGKYEALMRTRKEADPRGVFTPNEFSVPRAA